VIESPCASCRGEGAVSRERKLQIKIPAGVDTGSQLRMAGEGEAGTQGGPPGDLYVFVRVREHAFFRRDGVDLYCEIPVSFTQAALGATLDVPTPDGGHTRLAVPEGTQHGTLLRVRGQGVPHLGARGRGDLIVGVRVMVPTKLNGEQRKLLEQLGKTLPHLDSRDKGKGEKSILDKIRDLVGG
jgi:molecular chaperone DnaJ